VIVKRRDALVSIAWSGAALVLPGCASSQASHEGLSDDQLRAMLQLNGMDLQPGEGPKVLASFTAGRYTTAVDPTVQPQSDFDPDVDL
jgi:hypothetical protein